MMIDQLVFDGVVRRVAILYGTFDTFPEPKLYFQDRKLRSRRIVSVSALSTIHKPVQEMMKGQSSLDRSGLWRQWLRAIALQASCCCADCPQKIRPRSDLPILQRRLRQSCLYWGQSRL